jgi:hypothetical protein
MHHDGIFVELTNGKHGPVGECPLCGRLFKLRVRLPAPKAQFGMPGGDVQRLEQVVILEHVVDVHEDQEIPGRVANPTAASGSEPEVLFANASRVGMPSEPVNQCKGGSGLIVHDQKLPRIIGQRL